MKNSYYVHFTAVVSDHITVDGDSKEEAKENFIKLFADNPEYYKTRLCWAIEHVELEDIDVTDIEESDG